MRIIFIRHGKTQGNIDKKYIGKTDECLCSQGIDELSTKNYPEVETVICSPMKRCLQTAELIYPTHKPLIFNDLRECDFGLFEGKNYNELCEDPEYIKWLESNGTLPFPEGESNEAFVYRSLSAFNESVCQLQASKCESAAYVVHGGTIMAVLSNAALPKKSFYDYMVKNGCGYICEYSSRLLRVTKELL